MKSCLRFLCFQFIHSLVNKGQFWEWEAADKVGKDKEEKADILKVLLKGKKFIIALMILFFKNVYHCIAKSC